MTAARLAEIDLPRVRHAGRRPGVPRRASTPARLARLRERAGPRGYDRLVVYADREHSANLAYLTGFDPRFEEAVAGPRPDRASRRSWSATSATAWPARAPLPMRRHRFQDFSLPSQPRDRSRPLARDPRRRGDRPGQPGRRRRLEDVRRARTAIDAPAYLVDELRALVGADRRRRERHGPADRFRRTGCGSSTRSTSSPPSSTRPARPRRASAGCSPASDPGMTEREAVRLLDWNGMPLSCHLMLTAGPRATPRAAQPGRPADRARRPVHGRLRHLGRAQLPGGLRGRGRGRAAGRDRRLRRAAGRAVLRGRRRVVRGAPHRPDRRGAPRDRRSPAGRPVLRGLPQPGPPDPPRRMGQLADLPGLDGRAALGDGLPGRHHPGDRHATTSRPTSRTASRWPTRRCALRSRPPTRPPGSGSRRAAGSWPTRSASSSTRTSCRSRTCRPSCRRSCSDRIWR